MHESEKWKWSCSVVSDPQWPHGLQPSRLLHPWDFPGKSTGVGCHCLLHFYVLSLYKYTPWFSSNMFVFFFFFCHASLVCGILVPWPGRDSPLYWECGVLFCFLIIWFFFFGCAGSSLLQGLFSNCREWQLLSSCLVQASHCNGFSYCGTWALGPADYSSCDIWAQKFQFQGSGAQAP